MSDEPQIEKIPASFLKQVFPTDLKIALLWLSAIILAVYLPFLSDTPFKAILVIPGALFLPGYCFIAALFPKNDDISISERIALSIGLSIAIVPLIGFGLNYTPLKIIQDSILVALTAFILVTILIAHYRRTILPSEKRFRIPISETADTLWNTIFPKEGSRIDRLFLLIISLAILASVLLTIFMIVVPKEGERFTEFFILGENKTASDYPDLIIPGQNYSLFIGVGNHEYRNMNYAIETWTMLTEFDNITNSTTIIAMEPLNQIPLTIAHNETLILPYTLSLNKTGYNRVEFLLFNETVPGPEITGSDRINSSYQDLHLWVTN